MSEASKILVIIPAWNEEGCIEPIVSQLRQQAFDVLVVDDCSQDRTCNIAKASGAIVIRHPFNLGYAETLQTGYLFALEAGYSIVVQLDGDGQHDPSFVRALVEPIMAGQSDVVIGSRYLGTCEYSVPWARQLGQWFFGRLAGWITGKPLTDPTSGFQALSPEVLKFYCGPDFPDDYPDANMWILLHQMGFRACEVPVRMTAGHGRSMHSGLIRPFYYVCKMLLYFFMLILPQKAGKTGN